MFIFVFGTLSLDELMLDVAANLSLLATMTGRSPLLIRRLGRTLARSCWLFTTAAHAQACLSAGGLSEASSTINAPKAGAARRRVPRNIGRTSPKSRFRGTKTVSLESPRTVHCDSCFADAVDLPFSGVESVCPDSPRRRGNIASPKGNKPPGHSCLTACQFGTPAFVRRTEPFPRTPGCGALLKASATGSPLAACMRAFLLGCQMHVNSPGA